jgi:hypothetical protein
MLTPTTKNRHLSIREILLLEISIVFWVCCAQQFRSDVLLPGKGESMSGEFVSGGTEAAVQTQRSGETPLAINSALPEAGYEALALSAGPSGTAGRDLALKKKQETPLRHRPPNATTSRPEDRDAIRRFWGDAKKKAAEMEAAAKNAHPAGIAAAAFDLEGILDALWALRAAHDEDWRGILNFLQGVLKNEAFDTFTVDQCAAIKQVVDDYLGPQTVEKDDVRQARRILRRGGFDPWRPISAKEEG